MKLYLALLCLSFIWGIAFILIKMTVDITGVWGMVFLRCLVGAIALLPFFILALKRTNHSIPFIQLIILGTLNAGIPWGLLAWSETVINSNTTSVINALTPIFTALIGFLFFQKRLQKRQWMGIFIGFLGIIILMEFQIHHLFGSDFIGIGTMVLATIFYGFGSQYLKKYLQETNLIITTTISLFVASLVGLLFALVIGDTPKFTEFDISVTLIIILLGVLGSGLAHIILYYMIINGTPEFATTVAYIIPITAMIASFLILQEPITANLILGMLIIFSGIYLTSRQRR